MRGGMWWKGVWAGMETHACERVIAINYHHLCDGFLEFSVFLERLGGLADKQRDDRDVDEHLRLALGSGLGSGSGFGFRFQVTVARIKPVGSGPFLYLVVAPDAPVPPQGQGRRS